MLNERSLAVSQECADCPIRHRAVCARCESDELDQLEQIKYYRKFEAGSHVIWSGDRMDFVGSVVSGIASLTQTMEDGRTQMVGLMLPSDFIGRPGREGSAYDVVATTDLVMCCFRKKPFEDLMNRTPAHRPAPSGDDAGRARRGAGMDARTRTQDRAGRRSPRCCRSSQGGTHR